MEWILENVAAQRQQPMTFTEALDKSMFVGFSPLAIELLLKFSARDEEGADGSLLLTFTDGVELRIPGGLL